MGLGPLKKTRGKVDFWSGLLKRLQAPLIKLDRTFLAAIVRVAQATLGPVMAGVLGTAQYHYITAVNRLIDVHSFIALIIAASVLWVYGFVVVALEIKSVAGKLPKGVQSFLDGYFKLGQSIGDLFGAGALFTLGVQSVRAIYRPVCGGPFAADYCYSIPDLCTMRAMGNAKLGGFHCPLAHLQFGCLLALVTACLSFVSSYLNLLLFIDQRRRAASQTLQAMDEEGLTTSLVGGDFRYKLEMGGLGECTGEQVHVDMDPSSMEETKQPIGDHVEHFM